MAGIYKSPWTPDRIRETRKTYRLSQANLALLLGTPQQRVSEWEGGIHGMKQAYSRLVDLLTDKLRPMRAQAGANLEKYADMIFQGFGVRLTVEDKEYGNQAGMGKEEARFNADAGGN